MPLLPKLNGFGIRQDGAVAILTYNRPQSGNSLHSTVLEGLHGAIKWATNNPEIKVIVQTGAGKFFSTGRDMGGGDEKDLAGRIKMFREINAMLIKCEKILIAAVNGPAVGYGTTGLGLYDLVYAVPHAYFFTPFSKWALCPEGCSSVTFPAIMGHQKSTSLLLAGDRMSAEDLCVAGLISKIIPASTNDEFMARILEIAQRIAVFPPRALATSKKLVDGDRIRKLLEANDRECEHLEAMAQDPECVEAALSFAREQVEKKKAKTQKLKQQRSKL